MIISNMRYSKIKSTKNKKKSEVRRTKSIKNKTKPSLKRHKYSTSKRQTKISELPVFRSSKMPKKSSFKKRASAGLKVVWSPKVKHIERTPKKSQHRKNRHSPKNTHIYIKFNGNKTIKNSGLLHAQYKNKTQVIPIVIFKLHDVKKNVIIHLTINILTHSVLNVKYINEKDNTTQELKQTKNGDERIRMLFKFGDIIWIHGKTEIYRKSNTKGFNVNWLQDLYDSQYSYHY